MSTRRLFVAVEVPLELKEEISQTVQKLSSFTDVKWVESENIHLTLLFLGDQAETKIPDILYSMKRAAGEVESLRIVLNGFDAFPNLKSPKTFFVPVTKGAEPLGQMMSVMSAKLKEKGIGFDLKPFHGHVTLGRSKTLKNLHALVDALSASFTTFDRGMNVEQFVLFQSRLTEKGPIYTAVEKIKIGASK